jgi:thiamine-monophosphate kinase
MVKHRRVNSERDFLDKLRHRTAIPPGTGMVLGIGDDCAIFRPRGTREDLLFTTDTLVEGIHFRRDSHRPEDAGWKALARGLSDIAAMGGEPRFCLLSVVMAPWSGDDWLERFFRGFLRLAERERLPLAGGDLSHGPHWMCDVVVCGAAPRGKALRRDGARPGNAIYVSGALGASALGLAKGAGAAWKRHLRPEPRLALGRYLRERLKATSAMDLSDGLSLDLRRLCAASGVSAEITAPPRFRGATLEQALHGGEDYELLFTTAKAARVPARFQGLPLTRIGTIRQGPPGDVRLDGAPLAPLGYDHFQQL